MDILFRGIILVILLMVMPYILVWTGFLVGKWSGSYTLGFATWLLFVIGLVLFCWSFLPYTGITRSTGELIFTLGSYLFDWCLLSMCLWEYGGFKDTPHKEPQMQQTINVFQSVDSITTDTTAQFQSIVARHQEQKQAILSRIRRGRDG